MDIAKIEILKDRMCAIVSKMECSGNEKALAILDIGEALDMLDQAESDFWDLEGYVADIEDQENEIDELKKENKKLKEANEGLENQMDYIHEMAESILKTTRDRKDMDE